MAYSFVVTTSLGRIRSYCVQVEAGLEAMPGLDVKVPEWQALKKVVLAHRDASETGGDALTRARAVNRVKDASWDTSYTEGSGIAYLLSGKKAKNEPYASVMRVPARRATSFGHAKATEVGERMLAEVGRHGHALLTTWARGFAPINAALKSSGAAMAAAEDALDEPRFQKRQLVRQLNELIATTEAAILTAYPGRGSLADAILMPSWAHRKVPTDPDTGDELDEVDAPDEEEAEAEADELV